MIYKDSNKSYAAMVFDYLSWFAFEETNATRWDL